MEAFKPTQDPTGGVAEDAEMGDQALGADPNADPNQTFQGEAGPGPVAGPVPEAAPSPFPVPGNDRALTSGTGGLY